VNAPGSPRRQECYPQGCGEISLDVGEPLGADPGVLGVDRGEAFTQKARVRPNL
jgi:hypothetical protein